MRSGAGRTGAVRHGSNTSGDASIGRDVARTAAGTVAAQLIPLLAMPVLSRLYAPEAFGVFAVFSAVVVTVSLVSSGRYELAVLLPADDREASDVLALSLLVLLGGTVLAAGVAAVVFALGWMPPGVEGVAVAVLAPVAVLAGGVSQSLVSLASRVRRFGLLGMMRTVQAVVTALVSVAASFTAGAAFGLPAGFTAGACAAAVVLAWPLRGELARAMGGVSRNRLAAVARRYSEFPRVNVVHVLVDGVRDAGVPVVIAAVFGAGVNGLVAFAMRLMRAPATMFAASIGPVFFQRAAAARSEGKGFRGLLVATIAATALLVVLPYAALIVAGPQLFAWVFGAQWREAGEYARLLAPWLFVSTALSGTAATPLVAGKQRTALGIALGDAVLKLLALASGAVGVGAPLAVGIASASGTAVGAVLPLWYRSLAGRSEGGAAAVTGPPPLHLALVGHAGWSRALGDGLAAIDAPGLQVSVVPVARVRDVLDIRHLIALADADLVVRIGFRPGSDTWRGRGFDAWWRLVMRSNPAAVTACWWIGSDVQEAVTQAARGGRSAMLERMSGYLHLAGAPQLAEELADIGVDARVMRFPVSRTTPPQRVAPLPDEFLVLTYLPDWRSDFYGGPQIAEAARRLPDVPFAVLGGEGSWLAEPPANMRFLGWVDEPGSWFERAVVVVRMVEHDSAGGTVVDALFHGRYAIHTYAGPHVAHVAFGDVDGLVEHIVSLRDRHAEGSLEPNLAGRAYAEEHLEPERGLAEFVEWARRVTREAAT